MVSPDQIGGAPGILEAGPRGPYGYDIEQTEELIAREIRVDSSNVYSFVFLRTARRSGILYVTFLAWSPSMGTRKAPRGG